MADPKVRATKGGGLKKQLNKNNSMEKRVVNRIIHGAHRAGQKTRQELVATQWE